MDVTPSLNEKVRFLRAPAAYSHDPQAVDAIETHMAWVFLAGDLAFKMKKPVRYEFLDFGSLTAREFTCREEVRLNSRLAPGIYLGVAPLRLDRHRQLTFAGDGPIVEWLVKMKRLPAERMLDVAIENKAVSHSGIVAVARLLISFYRAAPVARPSIEAVFEHLEAEHRRNVLLLSDDRFALDRARTDNVLRRMAAVFSTVRPLIDARIANGAIVEGHGDLRPEHVCLIDPPVIIDCLEFNRELRLVDPYDEIAFLDLECDRLGAPWIGRLILGIFQRELKPAAPPALMAFYRASRGLLRARLALAHLTEPEPRTPEKWEPRARTYVSLADAALDQLELAIKSQPQKSVSP
jgi:aminoglycoside phosphotransferase family enzyme